MAKKIESISKTSSRDIAVKRLKLLTKYLITQDEFILERLISLITDEHTARSTITRIYSYIILYPKLLNYNNKHLNHMYDSIKPDNIEQWLYSFSEINRIYGINKANQFYFSKYKPSPKTDFFNLIRDYYDLQDQQINNKELNAFYKLYTSNIIPDNEINGIRTLLDGKERKSSLDQLTLEDTTSETIPIEPKFTQPIINFISTVKQFIKTRNGCKKCPMNNRGVVILDTNATDLGDVDIAFIGLNPGYEEKNQDLPFVGQSGQLLRKYLNILADKYKIKYLITNTILCYSKNESEIPNINNVITNCSSITKEIHNAFPSKVKILLGDKAFKGMGYSGAITKNVNKAVDKGVFLMFHPAYILRNPSKLKIFEQGFEILDEVVKKLDKTIATPKINESVEVKTNSSIPENKIIKEFSKDLTLFDVQVIGEQVIYIMIDLNGDKKYLIETVQFPVYLKAGQYKDCDYITDKIDAVVYLTAAEKESLGYKLHHNLKKHTQSF